MVIYNNIMDVHMVIRVKQGYGSESLYNRCVLVGTVAGIYWHVLYPHVSLS